jgi:hypothetical protein
MAGKNDEEKSVPTGSEPVDNSGTSKNNSDQQTSDNESQSSTDQTQSSQDKGSNQTEGSEQSGASDQQSQEGTTGGKSTEELLATLQKSQQDIQQISDKLDGLQKTSDDGQAKEPDYDAQLNELDRMLKEGEINLDEYQVRQRGIMESKAEEKASSVVDQKLEQQKLEQATEKYMQENPDFEQYYNSKEMQQLMKQNPLLDEVSAYERLKRSEMEGKVSELQQQIEALQKERDQAVKNGAQVTDTVGKDSGSALQHGEIENNKNLGPQQGMLAALQRARQAQ